MKKYVQIVGIVAFFASMALVGFLASPVHAATTSACQPPSAGVALTSSDNARIAQAHAWLDGMTKTRTNVVTSSSITPSQTYSYAHTGSVSGSFVLQGRSYPVIDTNVIDITSPDPIADSYRGVVAGTVLETPTVNRWIIQAYKYDGVNAVQVPVQALADGVTGNFSIDVSGVSLSIPGEWRFGILDAQNGYAPHGAMWPTPATYNGLEVQQLLVTDTVYYWSSVPARADGIFQFPNSNPGTKMFRLVETATSDILAEQTNLTGLIRSYQYASGEDGYGTGLEDRSFVYDQALAVFAALANEDELQAKFLVDGMLRLQTTSGVHEGGFVFAAPQLSPDNTDPLYRTGAHAIALDALLAYIEAYPNDANAALYKTAAAKGFDFVASTYASSGAKQGLYLGGYGQYSGLPQVFDAAFVIPWASTEHNMDIWHALMRASRVLGDQADNYSQKADDLQLAIKQKLYNPAENRLNQGLNDGGPDVADPLDVNSWGAMYLHANDDDVLAQKALDRLPLFEFTRSGVDGYAPFYDSAGYPGATPTVWFEGSFGVALAQYRMGDHAGYRQTIDDLSNGQESDGSFRYATDADATYEIGVSKSVAGTAWFVIATQGRDNSIWNTCIYDDSTSGGNLANTGQSFVTFLGVAGCMIIASGFVIARRFLK